MLRSCRVADGESAYHLNGPGLKCHLHGSEGGPNRPSLAYTLFEPNGSISLVCSLQK